VIPRLHHHVSPDHGKGGRLTPCCARGRACHTDGVGLYALPVADASVDHVLSTWTLCTIPDAMQALGEVRRVLRPGGAFRFVEHGLAPDSSVARLQQLLTPLQRRAFGGCHLDRRIDRLVAAAGLELTRLDTYYMKGPRALGYTFEGVAIRP